MILWNFVCIFSLLLALIKIDQPLVKVKKQVWTTKEFLNKIQITRRFEIPWCILEKNTKKWKFKSQDRKNLICRSISQKKVKNVLVWIQWINFSLFVLFSKMCHRISTLSSFYLLWCISGKKVENIFFTFCIQLF